MNQAHLHRSVNLTYHASIIVLGELINVLAFRAMIVPAKLLSSGVVGAAMLLNQVFNLPIGLQTVLYNIPIFLLGYRFLGRRFVVLSVLGVLSFSFLLDNVQIPVVTHDLLLVAVFGGVFTGLADGIILRFGGSTGGTDIIGLILSRRYGISLGQIFMVFNGIVIALGAVANNNAELAMYTLIMQFVASRVIDTVQAGTPRRFVLVISNRHEQIAQRIMQDMGRGVTYLQGSGAYTANEFRVLMCVMTRYEYVDLRRIVGELDPVAFTVVLEASDVIGRFDRRSPLQWLFR